MRRLRRHAPDVWLLVASLIAAAALGRLFQGDLGGRVLGPLLVSATVGSVVPSVLASVRVPLPLRAVAGTVAVILTSLWTAIGTATSFGLPTGHTWHVVQTDLRAARPLLSQFAVPFPPAPGLVFLAAMACGVVALLASVLLRASDSRDRVYPGLALLCPLGLLAFACSQSTPGSMAFLVILFVVAGALTLFSARAVDGSDGPSDTSAGWRVSAPAVLTACTMAAVLVVAVLVGPNAGGVGSSGPGVAPAVPLSAESLTSNLLSVEVHDADDVLFQATSHYRTYWQVAVLNVLRDGVWVPDSSTGAAVQRSVHSAAAPSPAGAASAGKEDFTTTVRIQDLASRMLPVPPGTVSVTGTPATLTDVGVVAPAPTTSGQQYGTVSAPPSTDPESLGGTASVAADPPALVQAETALPALPPSIEALARSITDGEQQPLAEAELLTNWFRSGQFHYTLRPPATPAGTDPLVDFLTQTRSGSCEQFAGAYVVLARTLGLPSRVVVGFTAGRYSGPGQVSVQGADAHAWPQVYLGPSAGWVSFEPTPQQPRGEVAPDGVVGPTGVTRTGPTAPPTTAPAGTAPFSVPTTAPAPVGSSGGTAPTTALTGSGSGPGVLGWTLVGVVALLAALAVLILLRRRRRWSPTGRSPDELALLAQAEVERALRQAGVERPLWQPLDLLFEDLRPHDGAAGDRTASLRADGMTVAAAADAALFDPLGASAERSRAAYEAALRVRKELKHAVASPAGVTEGL